jgi:hypothetical protein
MRVQPAGMRELCFGPGSDYLAQVLNNGLLFQYKDRKVILFRRFDYQ